MCGEPNLIGKKLRQSGLHFPGLRSKLVKKINATTAPKLHIDLHLESDDFIDYEVVVGGVKGKLDQF